MCRVLNVDTLPRTAIAAAARIVYEHPLIQRRSFVVGHRSLRGARQSVKDAVYERADIGQGQRGLRDDAVQSSRLALPQNRRSGQRGGAVGSASVGSMLFDGTHLTTSVSEEQQTAVKRELGLRRAATFRERSPCPQKHIELLNFGKT